jgi:hypothetical protein
MSTVRGTACRISRSRAKAISAYLTEMAATDKTRHEGYSSLFMRDFKEFAT